MRYSGFHRFVDLIHRQQRKTWQIHLGREIEADRLDALRQEYVARGQRPPSYTAMVVKAAAMAIDQVAPLYPEVNAAFGFLPFPRSIHAFDRISAGIAVARELDGRDIVTMGVVEDPEKKPLSVITSQLYDFAHKPLDELPSMRSCKSLFKAPWPMQWLMTTLGDRVPSLRRQYRGTFAVSTVGKFGVDWQLTMPQGATLQFGFGSVRERPIVRHGKVVPCLTFNLSVTFDRRLVNGRPCGVLLDAVHHVLSTADFGEDQQEDAGSAEAVSLTSAATTRPTQRLAS
jgi:pyruvate/2-oxoglutarate dehydrogenase complex dihydrolipoamide acyltransferase (E2) component